MIQICLMKNKSSIFFLCFVLLLASTFLISCLHSTQVTSNNDRNSMSEFDSAVMKKNNPNFPFDYRMKLEDKAIDIAAGDYFEIYDPIFSEYGLYANGACWEGLLWQALEKLNPDLLERINITSESDYCTIFFDSVQDVDVFLKTLTHLFNNEKGLRSFLGTIDFSEIDD